LYDKEAACRYFKSNAACDWFFWLLLSGGVCVVVVVLVSALLVSRQPKYQICAGTTGILPKYSMKLWGSSLVWARVGRFNWQVQQH
jgi:ABC-type sugar transport system permease subunit